MVFEYSRQYYEDVYHKTSGWYDDVQSGKPLGDVYQDHVGHSPKLERLVNWFSAFNQLHGSLLELAFNSGSSAYWLAHRYCLAVDCIDFSKALIPVAKQLAQNKVRCPLIGDVAFLPFKNNTYDYVCCLDVIEHLPVNKYYDMLQEIFRVLRWNGLVFVHVGLAEAFEHINCITHDRVTHDMLSADLIPIFQRDDFSIYIKRKEFIGVQLT